MQKLVRPDQIRSTKIGLAGLLLVTKIGPTWSRYNLLGLLNISAYIYLNGDDFSVATGDCRLSTRTAGLDNFLVDVANLVLSTLNIKLATCVHV